MTRYGYLSYLAGTVITKLLREGESGPAFDASYLMKVLAKPGAEPAEKVESFKAHLRETVIPSLKFDGYETEAEALEKGLVLLEGGEEV